VLYLEPELDPTRADATVSAAFEARVRLTVRKLQTADVPGPIREAVEHVAATPAAERPHSDIAQAITLDDCSCCPLDAQGHNRHLGRHPPRPHLSHPGIPGSSRRPAPTWSMLIRMTGRQLQGQPAYRLVHELGAQEWRVYAGGGVVLGTKPDQEVAHEMVAWDRVPGPGRQYIARLL